MNTWNNKGAKGKNKSIREIKETKTKDVPGMETKTKNKRALEP